MSQFLPHAPFVFELTEYTPGALEAIGYCGEKAMASHKVIAPEEPSTLVLSIDDQGIFAAPDEADLFVAHASLFDRVKTLCIEETSVVSFTVVGDAEIVGPIEVDCEAGIASVLLRLRQNARSFALSADTQIGSSRFSVTTNWRHPVSAEMGRNSHSDKRQIVSTI
jgi:beta-galactosidase